MKVYFNSETAQESTRFGVVLQPGENEFEDALAEKMLACGLVTKHKLTARELKAGKEPRES